MENNLIAREKEERITSFICTGIWGLSNIFIILSLGVYWLSLLCILFTTFCVCFDWLSNFIYYVKVENNLDIKDVGTKPINILRIISFICSWVLFIINYVIILL